MRKCPKHKYVAHQFDFEEEPHYLHFYKLHWWSRWRCEMNFNRPVIYRIKNGRFVEIL